jgi:adenosylcobinamide-GDP ribazoletransferase
MSDSPFENSPPPAYASVLAEWWRDLLIATAFLTRLPIRLSGEPGLDSLARAARAFPVVGLGIGLAGGVIFAAAMALGIHPLLAAFVSVGATAMLTGALHEDGLADVADGFGGGNERDDKLRIMRDSRIGTFGVLALILSVLLRGSALAALGTPATVTAALIACHAASRAFVVVVMNREPLARGDGLAATAGRPDATVAIWALGIGAGLGLLTLGVAAPITLAAGALAAWIMARLAHRQIGGYTGDVLGATQQLAEAAMLIAVVAQT